MRSAPLLLTLAAAACHDAQPTFMSHEPTPASLVIQDVRIFDGERVLPRVTVIVREGRIAEIAAHAPVPTGGSIVDGTNDTLLPGFIDCHAHVSEEAQLEQAAMLGTLLVLDMMGDPKEGAELKARAAQAGSPLADLKIAGFAVTAPGGHGTEYGMEVPTVGAASEVRAFVDARFAEGSDYLKIVYDDGSAYGIHFPTIDKATLAAAVQAAHAHSRLAIVHIGSLAGARDALEAGADGLAHLFIDRSPDGDLAGLAAARRAFVVPTLSVNRVVVGASMGPAIHADPQLAPYLLPDSEAALERTFPVKAGTYTAAEETIRALRAAGVTILAGTDAPNPGTTFGASLHGELELLVHAGLTPIEALAAATSQAADRFGVSDRGRIAPGKRADLILVRGDPTTDITTTRQIVTVWKAGMEVDRAGFVKRVEAARKEAREKVVPPPAGLDATTGLVSDFEGLDAAAKFGAGWTATTDAIMGGTSRAEHHAVKGGAAGSVKGSLLVTGDVMKGGQLAWAGVIFWPGGAPQAPANLSTRKGIAFAAKGDGKSYEVLVFAEGRGSIPARQTFVAGKRWKTYEFPFSAFEGLDGHDVTGIAFVGGPAPGKIRFQLDEVRLP